MVSGSLVQIGANVRYHSTYFAPSYMPAIGQFYNQKEKIVRLSDGKRYLNFHLKQARFFPEYYHVNYYFMKGMYLSMPNYPLNPVVVKMGLSWNFYN